MMATLDSHDRFPLSASDTLPGLRLSRRPISAWDKLGSASFIALICSLRALVMGVEVIGARCPDGRRPISSARPFSSSQSNSIASTRSRAATSGSLINSPASISPNQMDGALTKGLSSSPRRRGPRGNRIGLAVHGFPLSRRFRGNDERSSIEVARFISNQARGPNEWGIVASRQRTVNQKFYHFSSDPGCLHAATTRTRHSCFRLPVRCGANHHQPATDR